MSGALPQVNDTVEVKNLKLQFIRDIMQVNRDSLIADLSGRPAEPFRSKIAGLLDAIDQRWGTPVTNVRKK